MGKSLRGYTLGESMSLRNTIHALLSNYRQRDQEVMNDEEFKPFLEAIYLANSPNYVVSRIRANPQFDAFVRQYSSREMLHLIKSVDSTTASSFDLVKGYVALVGLLQRAEEDAINSLRVWTPTRLTWVPAIIAQWDATRRPTTIQSVGKFGNAIPAGDGTRSQSSTTRVEFSI